MFASTFFILFVVISGKNSFSPEAVPWIMAALALVEIPFWWYVFGREYKSLYKEHYSLKKSLENH